MYPSFLLFTATHLELNLQISYFLKTANLSQDKFGLTWGLCNKHIHGSRFTKVQNILSKVSFGTSEIIVLLEEKTMMGESQNSLQL